MFNTCSAVIGTDLLLGLKFGLQFNDLGKCVAPCLASLVPCLHAAAYSLCTSEGHNHCCNEQHEREADPICIGDRRATGPRCVRDPHPRQGERSRK